MGAVEKQTNGQVKSKKKNGVLRKFGGKKNGQKYPPFSGPYSGMRGRPMFPMGPGRGHMMGMGPPPPPPPGPRMMMGGPLLPPPPLFRSRVPPPPRGMGPRSLMPGPPPPPHPHAMGMRPRHGHGHGMHMPPMRPPPLMRAPPPPPMGMMGRFPPRGPPHMFPPAHRHRHINKNAKKNQKKKAGAANQYDLSTPWVTADIRAEFAKKDELLAKARASSAPAQVKAPAPATATATTDDWNAFKEQRTKCEKMYKTAKLEYIGKHPEEILVDSSDCEDDEQSVTDTFCDTCERSFDTAHQLDVHLRQHRTCGIDGCQFVAHDKVVEKHIEMQHVTGLYYRIKKTETPQDIAEWIAERKKRYPSREGIEQRQRQQQEMVKRGERIAKPKNRFDRKTKKVLGPMNARNRKTKKLNTQKKIMGKEKFVSLLWSKEHWNGNLAPFTGTGDLYESERKHEDIDINDAEWTEAKTETVKIPINNALGALIGAYRSSDESDDELCVPEPPEEVGIERHAPERPAAAQTSNVDAGSRKRKRHHNKNIEPKKLDKARSQRRKVTLLERLLEPQIRHERNVILQCIRYIVDNNFNKQ